MRLVCVTIGLALAFSPAVLGAGQETTLFGKSPLPLWNEPNMLDGILPVGPPPCGKAHPPYPPEILIKGKWLALVEGATGWSLQPTRASFREWENTASVSNARYLIRETSGLTAGPVEAALLSNNAQADTVILGNRSWRLHPVGSRLALDSGGLRWWLAAAPAPAPVPVPVPHYAECLPLQKDCRASPAVRYGIVWAGDLDGDREPDFIFRWSHDQVRGLTLGLSRKAAAQSKLKLVAALSDGCS